MTGSEFLRTYAKRSLYAWEAAVIELARDEQFTPWPFGLLTLTNGTDSVELEVMSDYLAVGPIGDHVRMPLTPGSAQDVCNLYGWLLPTPWLVYQTWRAAGRKLEPESMANLGASLEQYAAHSARVDDQIASLGGSLGIISGCKKDVVMSNLYQPKKVLIFGWYRPEPDVFSDNKPMGTAGRQPIQPVSNVHGDFYVDYSHGIRPVKGTCLVNGKLTATEDVYRHPEWSKLVSIEGPLRRVRYDAKITPQVSRPVHVLDAKPAAVDVLTPTVPGQQEIAASEEWRK